MTEGGYLFDNSAAPTGQRFAGLEATFDDATFRHLASLGTGAGWSCWEVGAGGGSVALWLAARVAPGGSVLATDLEPRWMPGGLPPNLQVERHNVASDPVPERAYHLIHARLVLVHLPERDRVLAALAAALRPGGWLMVEDFDSAFDDATYPVTADQALVRFVQHATRQLLALRGADTTYARTLPQRLERAGLDQVGAEGRVVFTHGGSAAAGVIGANVRQAAGQMQAAGLVDAQAISRAISVLGNPAITLTLPMMISAWGRKGP